MEITLFFLWRIKGFRGYVIDEFGRYWRLPFTDARGHRRQIKLLKPFLHDGMAVIRINNKLYKESYLNALQVKKRYKKTFNIK